jgi:hypothetical protein
VVASDRTGASSDRADPAAAGQPGLRAPSGIRLRTLADVFAYAAADGVTLCIDATEIRVRRPRTGRAGRKAFVSGKLKQNTIKTTLAANEHVSDGQVHGPALGNRCVGPRLHGQEASGRPSARGTFRQRR